MESTSSCNSKSCNFHMGCNETAVCHAAARGDVKQCCLAPSANLSSVVWNGQSRAALAKHFGIERKHLLFSPDGNAYFRKGWSVGFEKFPLVQIGRFWYYYLHSLPIIGSTHET